MLVTLAEILKDADLHGYAVIAPDFPTIQVANSILKHAEELQAPLALSFSPSLKPATGVSDYAHFIRIIREFASQAKIPVALHLDHAYEIDDIREAVDLGFTSVMIDASSEPWEVNVSRTQEVVRLAHAVGVSVESELGHVGTGGKYLSKDKNRALLTDPDQAAEFVRLTGIDALAVAIGTIHGEYQGEPNLDFERLQKLDSVVNVPLVLHGSSGTGEHNLRRTIATGIRKINVYSDLMKALHASLFDVLQNPSSTPIEITASQDAAVKKIMDEYLNLSGSIGAGRHWNLATQERVKLLFEQGYTCAEAVFMAFAEKEGFASDLTQLFGTMLGGGICKQGKTCGALFGGLAVIAARQSSMLPLKKEQRKQSRQAGIELMQHFKTIHPSTECVDLTGLILNEAESAAVYQQNHTADHVCLPALFSVADWLENHHH
ncbi:ketose-bisphosphate aldolase [Ornatilinea apprima]|uniref:ketose-bisphosphate aldolase n=1 Tax=Ornatilinea apprima TaxID=1134406 RepID=UPI0009467F1F|nr:ketose-bisphosphate aldolase [Ornatilinea apprima]